MKVIILSDIHDHIGNLEKIITETKDQVGAVIFCGDLCAPFTAAVLSKFELPIYACLGNVDEDHLMMKERGGENIHWTPLAKEYGQIELGGRKIAFCHYPKLAELLAGTGEFDAVFFGHTHNVFNQKVGETLLLNPGAVCGIKPSQGYTGASFAVYNTEINSAETFFV